MDLEEYNNLSPEEKSQFIWDNKQRFTIELANDEKSVKIWVDDMGFDPREVFNHIFFIATKKATIDDKGKETQPSNAILIFCQVKSEISGLIVMVNDVSKMHSLGRQDHSDIILSIDSFTTWAMSELDGQLKDSQVATNNSAMEANRISNNSNIISRDTNRYIAMFTSFAGGWYLYDFLYRIASEDTVIRHLSAVFPHYKNCRFIPCAILTFCAIGLLYILMQKYQKYQKRIAGTQ